MFISKEKSEETILKLDNIIEYLIRIVLVCIGTSGIMEIIISCVAPQVQSGGVIIFSCIISTIYACVLYRNNSWKVCIVPAGLALMLGIWKAHLIADGLAGIINDISDMAKDVYGIDYGRISIGEFNGDTYNNSRVMALLFAAVIIAFFVAIIVVYVRNMMGAVLIIVPFLLLFAAFNIIPDTLSVVLCTMFIFGVCANRQRENYIQTLVVLMISCVVAVLCVSFVPEEGFQRKDVFNRVNFMVQKGFDYIRSYGDSKNGTATAGMDNGKLGRIDSIQYTDRKILTLTTADIGKSQYFPEFIGTDYNDNAWENDKISEPVRITDEIVDFLEKYEGMRSYIDGGSGDFYNIVDRFKYSMNYENLDKTRAGSTYDINVDSFGVFSELFSEDRDYSEYLIDGGIDSLDLNKKYGQHYENTGNQFNPYRVVKNRELSYKQEVYSEYLDVPDEIRSVINKLIGNVSCVTTKDKEDYINKVKDYLKNNYTYNSSPGRVPDGKDFITYFLTESKNGYCTYFASSAVMMLRNAGIPARYVEGYALTASQIKNGVAGNGVIQRYTGTDEQRTFEYQAKTLAVTDRAAHAWVEAYMDGYGWVTVEVTPGSASYGVSSLDLTQAIIQKNDIKNNNEKEESENMDVEEKETQTEGAQNKPDDSDEDKPQQINKDNTAQNHNAFSKIMICMILVIAVGASAGIVIVNISNRKKNIQTIIDKGDVISMYAYFEKALIRAGLGKDAGMDYKEYAVMLDKNSSICHENGIIHIIDCVLECRFSANAGNIDSKTLTYRKEIVNSMNTIIEALKAR